MKKIFTLLIITFFINSLNSQAQVTLARWNFQNITTTNTGTSPVFSAGTAAADSGVLTAGSVCSAFHASAISVWSNPAGNLSSKSISSNGWASGDYYQIQFSSTGFNSINISWDQTSSGTGPKSFKLQYSIDGTNFTDVPGTIINSTYDVTNDSWSSTTIYNPLSVRTVNLSTISALNNVSNVYIRLVVANGSLSVNNAAIATTGTGRIDNFIVTGAILTPIKLTSFNAVGLKNTVNLSWLTNVDQDGGKFDIERSVDGSSFENISNVAANNLGNANYETTDRNLPAVKTLYYRLKIVNADGRFEYSNIQKVVLKDVKLTVSPNPANNEILINASENIKSIEVYDINGRRMMVKENINLNQTRINVTTLKDGTYIVKTLVDGEVTTNQIMVKH